MSSCIDNEGNNYSFNDMSSYFPSCPVNSNFPENRGLSGGIVGPDSHLEEAISPQTSSSTPSGRGRKKHRRRGSTRESTNKNVRGVVPEDKVCEDMEVTDSMFQSIPDAMNLDCVYQMGNKDMSSTLEDQFLINSATLEEVLSIKKMAMLQSPEIQELLRPKVSK